MMSEDQAPYDHGDGEKVFCSICSKPMVDGRIDYYCRTPGCETKKLAAALVAVDMSEEQASCHHGDGEDAEISWPVMKFMSIGTKRKLEDVDAENAALREENAKLREACKFKNDLIERLGDKRDKLREVLKRIINIEVDVRPEDDYAERAEEFYNFVAVATNLARAAYEETEGNQ